MKVTREAKAPATVPAKDLKVGTFCLYFDNYHVKLNDCLLDLHTLCSWNDPSIQVIPLPAGTELVLTSEV